MRAIRLSAWLREESLTVAHSAHGGIVALWSPGGSPGVRGGHAGARPAVSSGRTGQRVRYSAALIEAFGDTLAETLANSLAGFGGLRASTSARNRPVWLAGDLDDVLRAALRDDLAAAVAAFRADVDDPVGGLDDLEVVLDHHHGVALVDELVQHLQQLGHVVEMQAGGGLVEDVERAARRAAWRVPSRASRAAPRRPTASSPAGPP